MDVSKMKIQELTSFFDTVSRLKDLEMMMCRANNNEPTPNLKLFGNAYNILYAEMVNRIKDLVETTNNSKPQNKKIKKKEDEKDLAVR